MFLSQYYRPCIVGSLVLLLVKAHINENIMNLDDGKLISDIVESALRSGDLSKLRDLGPAVQQAVTTVIAGDPNRPGGSSSVRIQYSMRYDGKSYPPPQGQPYTSASVPGKPFATPVTPQSHPYSSSIPTSQTYSSPHSQAQPSPQPRPYPQPAQTQAIQTSSQMWSSSAIRNTLKINKGLPQVILSALGTFVFGLGTLFFLITSFSVSPDYFVASAVATTAFAIPTVVSAGFLINGVGGYDLANRMIRLASLFQRKSVYTVDELAAALGRTPKQIKDDLRKARAKGMLPQMHVDDEETSVMWGEEAYQQYQETKKAQQKQLKEAEERKRRLENPQTADIELFRSEGQATIKKIRAANDAIPGEEISAKLDELERITDRIFVYVDRYPQKLPETRRFMSYYLPTTMKLVAKYRQFDEMEFQPENIKQAKLDIESALDTINIAFSNLLESLFDHETMDVFTDIDVLKQMLEQEGLTNNNDFKVYSQSDETLAD